MPPVLWFLLGVWVGVWLMAFACASLDRDRVNMELDIMNMRIRTGRY